MLLFLATFYTLRDLDQIDHDLSEGVVGNLLEQNIILVKLRYCLKDLKFRNNISRMSFPVRIHERSKTRPSPYSKPDEKNHEIKQIPELKESLSKDLKPQVRDHV